MHAAFLCQALIYTCHLVPLFIKLFLFSIIHFELGTDIGTGDKHTNEKYCSTGEVV